MNQAKSYPHSIFSRLSEPELKLVWQWRNQPHIRQQMHNTHQISWQEHQAWFKTLQQSTKAFYIFRQNDRPIGCLYFHPLVENGLEWGCYLGEPNAWPGSGLLLEIAALDYACAQPGVDYLHAEVLADNHSVIKMHQFFGYASLPDKDTINPTDTNHTQPIKVFRYQTAAWRESRADIMLKLPKQISAAAHFIRFLD